MPEKTTKTMTPEALNPQPRLHLIVGPVGAGKSTLAIALCQRCAAVRLNLDEWMSVLFSPDRPETDFIEWYRERSRRCVEQIWTLTDRLVESKMSVVLEIGLIQRSQREDFLSRVDASGHPLTVHVVDASRELRRQRVEERNRRQGETFSMAVPASIFEMASDMWEPLDEQECQGRDVRFLDTERALPRPPAGA